MSENVFPEWNLLATTKIDLQIIRKQLDGIEEALFLAYRVARSEHEDQIGDAVDNLIAVKKSFGIASDLKPVKERQSAVIEQVIHRDVKP